MKPVTLFFALRRQLKPQHPRRLLLRQVVFLKDCGQNTQESFGSKSCQWLLRLMAFTILVVSASWFLLRRPRLRLQQPRQQLFHQGLVHTIYRVSRMCAWGNMYGYVEYIIIIYLNMFSSLWAWSVDWLCDWIEIPKGSSTLLLLCNHTREPLQTSTSSCLANKSDTVVRACSLFCAGWMIKHVAQFFVACRQLKPQHLQPLPPLPLRQVAFLKVCGQNTQESLGRKPCVTVEDHGLHNPCCFCIIVVTPKAKTETPAAEASTFFITP